MRHAGDHVEHREPLLARQLDRKQLSFWRAAQVFHQRGNAIGHVAKLAHAGLRDRSAQIQCQRAQRGAKLRRAAIHGRDRECAGRYQYRGRQCQRSHDPRPKLQVRARLHFDPRPHRPRFGTCRGGASDDHEAAVCERLVEHDDRVCRVARAHRATHEVQPRARNRPRQAHPVPGPAAHADHIARRGQEHLFRVLRKPRCFGEGFVASSLDALPRAHRKQAHQRHSRQSRHDDPKHEDREQSMVDAEGLTHGADLEQGSYLLVTLRRLFAGAQPSCANPRAISSTRVGSLSVQNPDTCLHFGRLPAPHSATIFIGAFPRTPARSRKWHGNRSFGAR